MTNQEFNRDYPLTSYQRDIWIEQCLHPDKPCFNIGGYTDVRAELDHSILEEAINLTISANDSLRIRLSVSDGIPSQRFVPETRYVLPYLDFSQENVPEESAFQWIKNEFTMTFDMDHGSLFQFAMVKAGRSRYFIMAKIHHICTDGWGISLINKSVFGNYGALSAGGQAGCEPHSYARFIENDREYHGSEKFAHDREYWQNKFTDIPEPLIAGGRLQTSSRKTLVIARSRYDNILLFCKENGCSAFHFFLGIFAVYFSRYYSREEIIIGVPVLNRPDSLFKKTVGLFANIIPVRIGRISETAFTGLLQAIKKELSENYRHQRYPLSETVRYARSRNPEIYNLFEVVVSYMPHDYNAETARLDTESVSVTHGSERNALTLFVREFGGGSDVSVDFDYQDDLFGGAIPGMLPNISALMENAMAKCLGPARDLPVVSAVEAALIAHSFNNTAFPYPGDCTITRLFEERSAIAPDRTAAVHGDESITYGELADRSARLARHLVKKGLKKGMVAGLMVERSIAMLTAVLAILKAGGTVLPVDPEYPAERKRYMLEDGKASVLLATPETGSGREFGIGTIDPRDPLAYSEDPLGPGTPADPSSLLYVIYTSGTTGKPKGVMLEQRNMVNLVYYQYRASRIGFSGKVLQFTTLCFDVCYQEIFSTLLAGGELHIISNRDKMDVYRLMDFIGCRGIQTVFLPTSFLKFIMNEPDYRNRLPCCVSDIVTAGEQLVLSKKGLDCLAEKNIRLHNHYGPSETHVVTAYIIEPWAPAPLVPPIGKPIDNNRIYILDERRQLLPAGAVGELFVTGDNVGRGYINRPDLTAEKFMPNPHEPGKLMYRTGDLARWLSDGNIEYMGRTDHQVKIRGYRIELPEIESRLIGLSGVKEAVVTARESGQNGKFLCAYYTADRAITQTELRQHLSEELPRYMIPSYFLQMEELPLNKNGKIDRKSLPDPLSAVSGRPAYKEPAGFRETLLAGILQKVLKCGKAGANDRFTGLGGDIDSALVCIELLNKSGYSGLSLAELFSAMTLRELAGRLTEQVTVETEAAKKPFSGGPCPLPPGQEKIFVRDMLEGANVLYNVSECLELRGNLDRERLEKSFQKVIERHDILRSVYILLDGVPSKMTAVRADFRLEYIEAAAENLDREIKNAVRPFDLTAWPLLRAVLIRKADSSHVLVVDIHSIIADRHSLELLLEEAFSIYGDQALAAPEFQYADCILPSIVGKTGPAGPEASGWWREALKGCPESVSLDTDLTRPPLKNLEGGTVSFRLEDRVAEPFRWMLNSFGADMRTGLLSALCLLVKMHGGMDDILIGVLMGMRNKPEILKTIGFFESMVPVRGLPVNDKSYSFFLGEIKDRLLEGCSRLDRRHESPEDILAEGRNIGRSPLYDIVLACRDQAPLGCEGLAISRRHSADRTCPHDLIMEVINPGGGTIVNLVYDNRLFTPAAVKKMADDLVTIIESVAFNPDLELGALGACAALIKNGETVQPGIQPDSDMLEVVRGIWQDVLCNGNIRHDDNFFELGGDSLKAIQISTRLHKLKLKLEIVDLLQNPTIRGSARLIRSLENAMA